MNFSSLLSLLGHSRSRISTALRHVESGSCNMAEEEVTDSLSTCRWTKHPTLWSALPERPLCTRHMRTIEWVVMAETHSGKLSSRHFPIHWENHSSFSLRWDWTIHTAPHFQGSLWLDTYLASFGSGGGETYGSVAITMIGNCFQMLPTLEWEQRRGSKLKSLSSSAKNFPEQLLSLTVKYQPSAPGKRLDRQTETSGSLRTLCGTSPLVLGISNSESSSLSWKEFVCSPST